MPIDIARYIGAEDRELVQLQRDGRTAWVLKAARTFPTDPADLWDALTSAERIPRWFLPITGELRPGGRYQFKGNAGGEIQACDPPRHLQVTWEYGGEVSWLAVWLEPAQDRGTRLRFEHTAFVPQEMWKQYGPGATGVGWDLGLLGLVLHVETGDAVAETMGETWAASEEGKAYMRASSDAWAQASMAAGTDPADAADAAARTIAFYTGEAQS